MPNSESRLAPEEERMTYYSIPLEDFKKRDESLSAKKFNWGDRVTRENFNDFLIQSYALSLGDYDNHMAFLVLQSIQTGFDFRNTLKNFHDAGCFDALTASEREAFLDAFRGVKKHKDDMGELSEEQAMEKIGENLKKVTVIGSSYVDETESEPLKDSYGLNPDMTPAEFVQKAKKAKEESSKKLVEKL